MISPAQTRPFLLTGFEPFGQWSINPSELLVRHFSNQTFGANERLICEVLPTVYGAAGQQISELILKHQPSIVLSLGLSGGRTRICLERFALNIDDVAVADNAANIRRGTPIDPDGPAALKTPAELNLLLQTLRDNDLDAEISNHAGTYVCNHVFYQQLRSLGRLPAASCGLFLHLPMIQEGYAEPAATETLWTLDRLINATTLIIEALIAQRDQQNRQV